MKFFKRVAIYFYVLTISLLSGVVVLFVGHAVSFEDVTYYLNIAYTDQDVRLIVGLGAFAFILVSFILERIIEETRQRERTIAFDNPAGRVSISLDAVEDLVRRLMYRVPEVKEIKPGILVTKKGIEIECRVIFKADVNIPDMTSKLQELIKNKIQEILGLEETIVVRMHVVKITSEEGKSRRNKAEDEEKSQPAVPFQGYRS